MKPYPRELRVASLIREIVGEFLAFEAKDPRLLRVRILRVTVSQDLRHALLLFTYRGSREEAEGALAGAMGAMRRRVAAQMRIKKIPEFRYGLVEDERDTEPQ